MVEGRAILDRVCRAIDLLVRAGEPYEGLIPSILDRETGRLPDALPPPIPGQRMEDRSYPGTNLMHDQPLLATMSALAVALGRSRYKTAVDAYLGHWAKCCTDTPTGLFPWGEHAFWDLRRREIGNSYLLRQPSRLAAMLPATHDHLRQAPVWLLEALDAQNPRCIERFAEGMDFHWKEGEPDEYSRHAALEARVRPSRDRRSFDFPRHGGFYLLDWTFAHRKTRKVGFLRQVERMMNYWWARRDARGLLPIESRSPESDAHFYNTNAPGQTLSFAASLLDAAPLLAETEPGLAKEMRRQAGVYTAGFLAAPHDPSSGTFVLLSDRATNEPKELMPVWGSRYGIWPASYVALIALRVYRSTGNDQLLVWASAAGMGYATEPLPRAVAVPAIDAGLGVALLADLYDITQRQQWLEAGLELAGRLLDAYLDAPLPRGATGIEWYESQLGPAYLLHGLARVALLSKDGASCALAPDYTAR